MRVIHDAQNVLIDHFKAGDRIGPPFVPVLAKRNDCQLTVHFCHYHSPRHCQSFIVPEVWRFVDVAGKAICDTESSIRPNEFADPFPISLIEPVNVETQQP
jgi:hypothetical protein